MKIQINDIIEVKFKNIPDICHYYICKSTVSNKINTGLPYELIWLDKGLVELYFRDLDFKEVSGYLNRCDNALYGIESINISHKDDYKLVHKRKKSKSKQTVKKPKKNTNYIDELLNKYGRTKHETTD